MNDSILKHINYGYKDIEPVIISMIALSKNFMLIGKHGTGKTKLAKVLSQGFYDNPSLDQNDTSVDNFVFYDATKDDLISIAGIPSPESMKSGKLDFVKHKRSIWDKSTIVVDEITRASKENQNMWLEILEERTCFGLPLSYRSLIATANPESYASANQLDEALMDRFLAVVPVPDFQTGVRSEDIKEIVKLNLGRNNLEKPIEIHSILHQTYSKIRKNYQKYSNDNTILKSVSEYTSQVVSQLLIELGKRKEKVYISPRSYGKHFPDSILSMASYFDSMSDDKPLIKGAEESLKYCLATKFGIDYKLLIQIHDNFKTLLEIDTLDNVNELRKNIARLTSIEEKLDFLKYNLEEIQGKMKSDEVNYFVGSIIKETQNHKEYLIDLFRVVNMMSKDYDNIKENLKGTLILDFHGALNKFFVISKRMLNKNHKDIQDKEVSEKLQKLERLAKDNELLVSSNKDIIKFNKYLLKGNFDINPTSIYELLSRLDI